jgi:hypothetical protein
MSSVVAALPTHIEGFVVIEVPQPLDPASPFRPSLDVVGKYTARPTESGVSSIDIEEVTPQLIVLPAGTTPPGGE